MGVFDYSDSMSNPEAFFLLAWAVDTAHDTLRARYWYWHKFELPDDTHVDFWRFVRAHARVAYHQDRRWRRTVLRILTHYIQHPWAKRLKRRTAAKAPTRIPRNVELVRVA